MKSKSTILLSVLVLGLLGADIAVRYRESVKTAESDARVESLRQTVAELSRRPAATEAARIRAPSAPRARTDAAAASIDQKPTTEARPEEKTDRRSGSVVDSAEPAKTLPRGEPSPEETVERWRDDLSRQLTRDVPERELGRIIDSSVEFREKVAPFKRGELDRMDADGYQAARDAFRERLFRTINDSDKTDRVVAIVLQF